MLVMEHPNHFIFRYDHHSGRCYRRRRGRGHANSLPGKTAFPEKISRPQNCYNSLFARLINYGKLHTAFLNVNDSLRGIALREYEFLLPETLLPFFPNRPSPEMTSNQTKKLVKLLFGDTAGAERRHIELQ